MDKKSMVYIIVVALAFAFVAGCAKVPQEKVDLANTTLESAKSVGADEYVPEKFKAAKDSLNSAMAEIQKQGSKFSLSRNYDRAAKTLDAVNVLSEEAKNETALRKEQVRQEAEAILAQSKTALYEAKQLLKKAPRGKEGKAALEAIELELTTADNSLVDVTNLISAGNFLQAKDKANAALTKINGIKEELQTAINKKKGRK